MQRVLQITAIINGYCQTERVICRIQQTLFERVGPDVSLFPSSSLSACFRLVEADLGVAALPRALGAAFVAEGKIKEFDPGWVPNPTPPGPKNGGVGRALWCFLL